METATNTNDIEITRIDPLSFVKVFTGIIAVIAIILLICCLFSYVLVIKGNMIFLPGEFADLLHFITISNIMWCICAVIILSLIFGFLFAVIYNIITRKVGGIILLIKK